MVFEKQRRLHVLFGPAYSEAVARNVESAAPEEERQNKSRELAFYTNRQSCVRIARWMPEEIGPHRTEVVEFSPGDYLSINPMGATELDDRLTR